MRYCNQCVFEIRKFEPIVKEEKEPIGGVHPDILTKLVCDEFKTTKYRIASKSRERIDVFPRMALLKLLLRFTPLTISKVGEIVRRHYSTAIYARDEFIGTYEFDLKYNNIIKKLTEQRKTKNTN